MRYDLKKLGILFFSLILVGCSNKLSAPEVVAVVPDLNTITRASDNLGEKAIDILNSVLNSDNFVVTEETYNGAHPENRGIMFLYKSTQKVRLNVEGKDVTITSDNFYLADHGSYVVLITKQDESFNAWALEKQVDFTQIYKEAKDRVLNRTN